MIRSLEEIQLPQLFIDMKDVYRGSFIEVICGKQLTHPTSLQIGIKTDCTWSAINFIIAINQWLKLMCQWNGQAWKLRIQNVMFCMRGGVEGTGGTVQNLIQMSSVYSSNKTHTGIFSS